jgi:NAD(P)-dependent dehydrogenase (short-subunit alcohol dehydrogenase family)
MRFTGRNVVVTGAGSGIGRATALMMCEEGARVLGVDKTFGPSSSGDYGDRLTLLELDIAAPEAPDRVVRDIEDMYGVPYVLVNAAGVLRIGPMMTVRREDWADVISVNLTAAFFMIQAVAAAMIRGKVAGRIVNVSSVHAVVSEPNAAAYVASKGGLEAMTRTVATELAPHGILVNCVRPGATWTGMSKPIYTPEVVRALETRIPLGTIAQPEWIASAICYLSSDECKYSTGAALDVDGGYAMDGSLTNASY